MELLYRNYGSGKPVIILHGLFGMSDNWVTFGKELSKNFEVFIPDQRNHGRSPHSEEFNYDILCKDIVEFIKVNKLEGAAIIGHSMGGKVAMLTALTYESLIDKLIVLDISPASIKPSKEIIQIINAIRNIELTSLSSRQLIKEQLLNDIDKSKIIDFLLKNIRRDEKNIFRWKFNFKAISENLTEIAGDLKITGEFNKPCLFIGGELSPYISGENVYRIFDLFPEARIEVLKNAGHWLHVDAYEELLKLTQEFLDE